MSQTTGSCAKLVATAERPAYAAHFVQIGGRRARMLRLGYTEGGVLALEPFSGEVHHTIFISGTIRLVSADCPASEASTEASLSELRTLLSQHDHWQVLLP